MNVKPALLLGLTLALPLSATEAQTTRRVPGQYATIQAAVNASGTGDTVLVDPGIYYENVHIQASTIRLLSAAGPEATILDGAWRGSVLTVTSNSTVEGFTIRNGQATAFCPLPCGISVGGGVFAAGNPVIKDNVIVNNAAGGFNCNACGGGIGTVPSPGNQPVIVNNVIAYNSATSTKCLARGGGVFCEQGTLLNNTVYGNTATFSLGGAAYGGGIYGGTSVSATNCIVWGNRAQVAPEIGGNVTTLSCYLADPRVMDATRGDFHLRYDSPCRDRGRQVTGLPAADFEGDPRAHGAGPDIGADEFHPHLYVTGDSRPGGIVHVKMIDRPGQPTLWAYSLHPALLSPPIPLPGLGQFYLNAPFFILSGGITTSLGIVMVPVPLHPALPKPIDFPLQALIGTRLSNPFVVRVR